MTRAEQAVVDAARRHRDEPWSANFKALDKALDALDAAPAAAPQDVRDIARNLVTTRLGCGAADYEPCRDFKPGACGCADAIAAALDAHAAAGKRTGMERAAKIADAATTIESQSAQRITAAIRQEIDK